MKLSKSDKAIIENGQCLNDFQNMLQYYFPDAEGLKNSLFQYRMKLAVSYYTRSSHWVVILNVQSQSSLRDHLISCFENYMLTPFP